MLKDKKSLPTIMCVDDEEKRTRIFNSLLIWPFINLIIYIIIILAS